MQNSDSVLVAVSLQSKKKANCRILFWHYPPAGFPLPYHTQFQNTQRKWSVQSSPPNPVSSISTVTVHSTSGIHPISKHCDLLMKHPPPPPQSQGCAGVTSYRRSPAFQNKLSTGNRNRRDCFFCHSSGLCTSLVHLPGFISTERGRNVCIISYSACSLFIWLSGGGCIFPKLLNN